MQSWTLCGLRRRAQALLVRGCPFQTTPLWAGTGIYKRPIDGLLFDLTFSGYFTDHHGTRPFATSVPSVMTGRHIECIARAVLDLRTIIHLHDDAAFENIADVCRLA
jgi:hypothetical protein